MTVRTKIIYGYESTGHFVIPEDRPYIPKVKSEPPDRPLIPAWDLTDP